MFCGPEYLSWLTSHGSSRRKDILLLLGEVFYKCQLGPADRTVQFHYVFSDFMPMGPIDYWQRGVEVSNSSSGFVYFLIVLSAFGSHILTWLLGINTLKIHKYLWRIDPFIIMQNHFFIPDMFSYHEVCFV